MKKVFDTYCIDAADLELARERLEAMISMRFALHESTYWGGQYYLASSGERDKVTIRRNLNSYTGELNEPGYPDCLIIVSVVAPESSESLEGRLTAGGLRLLHRSVA